jgi:hypothetical protein
MRVIPGEVKAREIRIEWRFYELIGKPNKNAPSAYAISFTFLCIEFHAEITLYSQ